MDKEIPAKNEDVEIWRREKGDYYSPSIFVTKQGNIGINVSGTCIIHSIEYWHKLADCPLPDVEWKDKPDEKWSWRWHLKDCALFLEHDIYSTYITHLTQAKGLNDLYAEATIPPLPEEK